MKNNQHEQLFTELTAVEAAVVEGGRANFTERVVFDDTDQTRRFRVSPGGTIRLNTANIRNPSPSQKYFTVSITNLRTGNQNPKSVEYGRTTDTVWTDVRGGNDNYVIKFYDDRDGYVASGNARVVATWCSTFAKRLGVRANKLIRPVEHSPNGGPNKDGVYPNAKAFGLPDNSLTGIFRTNV